MASKVIAGFIVLAVITFSLFILSILSGPVDLTFKEVIDALCGAEKDSIASAIVMESRLPMSLTATVAGVLLSLSGLILQTVFRNPLAGPTLFGVSSGAALGVALVIMGGATSIFIGNGISTGWVLSVLGATCGSMVVICLLLGFSGMVRNGVMLLILGVMISYLASSVISLLSYIAPSESLKNFTVWGLGSYAGVTLDRIPVFAIISISLILCSGLCVKPLNAFLLGERYASSLGYSIKGVRSSLLLLSGLMTAIVTAYCGPIGFIGLIVPHIARIIFRTSNHSLVIPASILIGASVSLICTILANGTITDAIIPINVVTPIIGIPFIFYLIIRRDKLPYFK